MSVKCIWKTTVCEHNFWVYIWDHFKVEAPITTQSTCRVTCAICEIKLVDNVSHAALPLQTRKQCSERKPESTSEMELKTSFDLGLGGPGIFNSLLMQHIACFHSTNSFSS